MTRAEYLTLVVILGGLAALQPLATETSLPAIPAIAGAFGVDNAAVQYTLSAQLAGVAFGQLFVGPVSDRFGRKPVILGGLLLFAVAAIACATADTLEQMTVSRFVIGLALCAGQIMSRAVARDHYDREAAAKLIAYMMTVFGLFPIVTPPLGGWLTQNLGWPSVFWTLAVYGAAAAIVVALFLRESLARKNPEAIKPRAFVSAYLLIIRNRTFLGYLVGAAFSYGGLFGFLLGVSVVAIGYLGLSAETFGYLLGATLSGFVLPQWFSGRFVGRYGIDRLLAAGLVTTGVAGIAMAALAWADVSTVAAIFIPMFVYLAGLAFVVPQATAGALSPFPHMAGAAASLFGFLLFCVGAAAGTLVALLDDGTQLSMTNTIGATGVGMFGVLFLFVLPRLRRQAALAGKDPLPKH